MTKNQLKLMAKEIADREWFHVIERPGSPVLGWDSNISSINPCLSKILQVPLKVGGFLFFQNKLLVDMEDHQHINDIIREKYTENKKDIKRLCVEMEKDCDKFRNAMDKISTEDPKSILTFFDLHRKAIYHFRWIFNAVEIFESITQKSSELPLKQNFITKYNISLHAIIKEIQKQKKLVDQIEKGNFDKVHNYPNISKKIKTFLKKFSWINMLHHQGKLIDFKTLMSEIRHTLNFSLPKTTKENSRTVSEDVWFLRYFIFLRTHLSESNAYADAKIKPALEILGKKFDLKYDDITFLTEKEIITLIAKSQLDTTKEQIHNRQQNGYACINLNNTYSFIEGQELQTLYSFYHKFSAKEKLDHITELKGITGNKGFVIGTAKIIQNVKEFNKLNPGDILVANSTTPNYVPIMTKAAAFLTDEGGITNHAAIISRELNKPCIVGLKHATKVFQDGDLLEVNADDGIVKILKRNKI